LPTARVREAFAVGKSVFALVSLKSRVLATAVAMVLLSVGAASFTADRVLRAELVELVGQQQRSTAAVLAATTASEVRTRLAALEQTAARLADTGLADTEAAQRLIETDGLTAPLFNKGLFVTRADGVAWASVPHTAGRLGLNHASNDAVAAALASGQSSVGRPALSPPDAAPELLMAAAIRAPTGAVIGVLAGVTDLARANFLDAAVGQRYGDTGGIYVVAPRHRLIVTGTDKSRILEPLPPAGANPAVDQIVAGHEGTLVFRNAHGVEALNSGRHVPAAGWDIVVSLPTHEAFAPVRRMHQNLWAATAALLLLCAALGTWLLRRELAPMQRAAQALSPGSPGALSPQPLAIERHDEIGTLIAGFNDVLQTLRQREQELRVSDSVLKAVSEAVVITGPDGTVISTNQAHETISGYSNDEMLGRNCRLLQGPLTDRDTVARMREAVATGHTFQGELINYRKDGSSFWNDLSIAPVHGDDGRLSHFVGITRDITVRRSTHEQMAHLAFIDALTQLPNRRLLDDRLAQALAASERSGLYGAVMYLDLDGFKPLNDTHGHGMGDLVLVEVAQRLRACVRATDTVARVGGDEFVVVVGDLASEAEQSRVLASAMAEKICEFMERPGWQLPAASPAVLQRCSVSVGVALFLGHQLRPEDTLRRADAAMYRAKHAGGNGVNFDSTDS